MRFNYKLTYVYKLFLDMDKTNVSTLQRPRNPPPPAPSMISSSRMSNGRSNESLSSMCSDHGISNPVPPPRKVSLLLCN